MGMTLRDTKAKNNFGNFSGWDPGEEQDAGTTVLGEGSGGSSRPITGQDTASLRTAMGYDKKYDYDLDDQFSPFYSQGASSGSSDGTKQPTPVTPNNAQVPITSGADYGSQYGSIYGDDGGGGESGAGVSQPTRYKQPIGKTTTSTTAYSGKMPSMGDRPALSLPAWGAEQDRGVRARAQKISGSDTLAIKQALQQAAGQTYRNPLAASYVLSRALQKAGVAMGSIREKAEGAAESAERSEFQLEQTRALMEHNDQVSAWQQEYQALWNEYMSTATTATVTRNVYAGGESGGGGAGVSFGNRDDGNSQTAFDLATSQGESSSGFGINVSSQKVPAVGGSTTPQGTLPFR